MGGLAFVFENGSLTAEYTELQPDFNESDSHL